ncbi:reticulon-like protein B5 [Gossypium australe]|uniref:Reticulon-like protein B5 n=1 Tax=Gossypium australe TaxID=47621 RepID=A0A5B6W1V0_9ROSI|nr:reticulon-like protein B5 [Gossypium australe]
MSVVILWMIILSLTGGDHLYFLCLEERHPCFGFQVIAASWVLSIVELVQLLDLVLHRSAFILLHMVPVFYEKYEEKVDLFAEEAMVEIKKQYAVFNVKVLSNIPRGPLKTKKV